MGAFEEIATVVRNSPWEIVAAEAEVVVAVSVVAVAVADVADRQPHYAEIVVLVVG